MVFHQDNQAGAAAALDSAASAHEQAGEWQKALAKYLEAEELWRHAAAKDPGEHSADLITCWQHIAVCHIQLKQYPDARSFLTRVLQFYQRIYNEDPKAVVAGYCDAFERRAAAWHAAGESKRACEDLFSAVQLARHAFGRWPDVFKDLLKHHLRQYMTLSQEIGVSQTAITRELAAINIGQNEFAVLYV